MPDRALLLADQLADADRAPGVRHPGGAELTDAAAIEACPWKIDVATVGQLDASHLDRYDVIVLGNAQRATPAQLATLAKTGRLVSFEHDVRLCRWRGNFPASRDLAHALAQRCWCPHHHLAELYRFARGVLFLTKRQQRAFLANPFFRTSSQAVIGSSLFGAETLERLSHLGSTGAARSGALYLWAPDRIKGTGVARQYCEKRGLPATMIRDKTPAEVLEMMGTARTFVYLPIGLEPAGRMPVEARLAGCEVVVNPNVGVSGEDWWHLDRAGALAHLEEAPRRFWRLVERFFDTPARPLSPRPRRVTGTMATASLTGAALAQRVLPRLPTAPGVYRRARLTEHYPSW